MIRSGIGMDAHRFEDGRALILGGVSVASEKGLAGHSDADVLCHAIMDALLGAIADGDIGTHYPPTDPQWKDANSLELLAEVVERVREKGFSVSNVDSTVIAEAPRLQGYIPAMRDALAGALGIVRERVSVKATTTEGMGALGRGEGIAAVASVTVAGTSA